jgi:lipoprotein-anchoring transpeptidase ErfK/SrfK
MRPRRPPVPLLAVVTAVIAACTASGPSLPPEAAPPAPAPVRPPLLSHAPAPSPSPADEPADAPHEAQAKSEPPSDDPPPEAPAAPRITSQGYFTWIYGRPRADKRYIGLIRYGQSVALRSTELVKGESCKAGFFQIEPRGFVCQDRTVTLEPSPRFLAAAASAAPAPGPFPFRYAFSNGTPMYNRIATAAEQKRFEARFLPAGKALSLPETLAAHEDLATRDPILPADPIPGFLENRGLVSEGRVGLVHQEIPLGSMLSFTKVFSAEGRTWLFSADRSLVPADRVRLFRPSAFHGVRLGDGIELPIAWMRKTPKHRYRRLPSGILEKTASTWPVRGFVRLTGASVLHRKIRYLETAEKDTDQQPLYIAERDATVAAQLEKLPRGVAPDQKSIVISITQGTLVAYEGIKPVYATLMSPGKGGVPVPGQDPVEASTTPLGTYYVTFKNRATTMSPDKDGEGRTLWISDVPHTQFFNPPFALHAAYWHERFGEPTSAGCINVSPIDADALFQWSDPQVPSDWQGATGAGAPENGATTAIVVRR